MCLPETLRRLGANLPRVRAPPEPAKLWHMAQFTRNSSPPMATLPPWPLTDWLSGIAGPGAKEATYAASAAMSSLLNWTRCLGAWTSGLANGIRPVPTWKSTAAAPTPAREGATLLPWACRPWQVAQLARKSFLPRPTWSAPEAEACAGRGASTE